MTEQDKIVKLLVEGAARISSEGHGLPLETFTEFAEHILDRLVGYRAIVAARPQNVDYLARSLQSVYVNLQDYQGEIP